MDERRRHWHRTQNSQQQQCRWQNHPAPHPWRREQTWRLTAQSGLYAASSFIPFFPRDSLHYGSKAWRAVIQRCPSDIVGSGGNYSAALQQVQNNRAKKEKQSETAERLEMKHHKSEIILFVNFTEFSLLRAIPVRPGMLVPFGSVLTSERGLASHPPLYTPCGRGAVCVCVCVRVSVCVRVECETWNIITFHGFILNQSKLSQRCTTCVSPPRFRQWVLLKLNLNFIPF